MKFVSIFLFGVALASQAFAGEIELIKVSAHDQQAVIREDDGSLKVIKTGDRIEENAIVLGVSEHAVFIKDLREASIRKITKKSSR